MNIIRIDKNNQVNGDGLRCVVWFAGCSHHCPQCHNPETWDDTIGENYLSDWFGRDIVKQMKKDEIDGITLTGGDPFYYKNRDSLYWFVYHFKELFPHKTIWCYTGYTFEQLQKENPEILAYIDVLIDGPYIAAKNPGIGKLKWRGSSNQRVIDVQETLKQNQIVEWKDFNGLPISENERV